MNFVGSVTHCGLFQGCDRPNNPPQLDFVGLHRGLFSRIQQAGKQRNIWAVCTREHGLYVFVGLDHFSGNQTVPELILAQEVSSIVVLFTSYEF